jgi:L-ribulose-5-phosphate 3-epimerase
MQPRRTFLKNTAALAAGAVLLPKSELAWLKKQKFKIGACDWSIGPTCDLANFDTAQKIGLNGIQVGLGTEKDDMRLRQPEVQKAFLEASKRTGVAISSLAIGELNNVPYKSDPRTETWVSDSIDVAKNMGVSVVLLAFFLKNDLRNDKAGQEEVIRRLRKVAPKAEKAGITLGIESYLTAEEHLYIMEQVGSKSIKTYYDFRNATDAGNDIYKEIKLLGRKNICEMHMKENRQLLGTGTLDWEKICAALADINHRGDGWMQIEWAKPDNANTVEAYQHNLKFLKGIFRT